MSLVRITRDLSINPQAIASLSRNARYYMNGSGPTVLTIRMMDGEEHRIEHTPHYLDGNDVYAIERRIEDALAAEG